MFIMTLRSTRLIWGKPMQSCDDGLDPFTEMPRFGTRLARMDTIPSVLEVTLAYLANWTSERISAVKSEDEGSAPFDRFGQPFPLHTLPEVVAVSRALQVRCETLRAGGIAPTPTLSNWISFSDLLVPY